MITRPSADQPVGQQPDASPAAEAPDSVESGRSARALGSAASTPSAPSAEPGRVAAAAATAGLTRSAGRHSPDPTPVGEADHGRIASATDRLAELFGRFDVESTRARLVVALAIAAIAVAARVVLSPLLGETVPFLLYFPAIVVAASLGGAATGLVTVAVCAIAQAVLFELPLGSPLIADSAAALRVALFVLNGSLVSLITGATFASRRVALRSRSVAERLYRAEAQAREGVESAERRTRVLYETAAAMSDAVTPEDVADVIIRQGVLALGATAGAVAVVNAERTGLRILRAHGCPEGHARAAEATPLDAATATATAIRSGQPIFLPDRREAMEAFPYAAAAIAETGAEALAIVPLGPEARPIGALILSFPTRLEFPPAEREFILALGHECAQALERARLYRAEQDARRAAELGGEAERRARAEAEEARLRVSLLADVSAVLSSSLDYEMTLQQVAELCVPRLGDWVTVDLVRADGSAASAAVAHADPARLEILREYRHRAPIHQHRFGSIESIRTGEPLLVPEVREETLGEGLDANGGDLARQLEIRSYLSVPLRVASGVIGAIAFASSVPGRYGTADLSIAEDIARRSAATIEHSNLYRQARQFIATVDATLDAVFMFEPSTLRFTYVNQGAIAQVGYDRSELLSMRATDIKPDFDETRYRQLLAPLIDGSRDHLTFSTVHRHRDGFDIPVEVFLQHVRLPGGEARMIITSRDIRAQIDVQASLYRLARSERARAAELSAVIQGMSDGVLVCDADGRIVLANQAAWTIIGDPVDGYAELVARMDPDGRPLPALGTSTAPVEARVSGQDRWIEIGSARVADGGEPAAGAGSTILVLRDVTNARRAQAAREAFIGVLSHELRTPITTIYGNTKIMRRISDPATQQEMLGDVEAEADRLYRLVEDLLILSRAETGLRLDGEPVLLQHLIPTVLASERGHWPRHAFIDRVSPGLPPVAADRTYLEQVIRNLATNAAKYGQERGTIEVHAELTDAFVTVRVLDEGQGVPEGEEEHIFDLFYRSAATARRASGAGIGLYVCRALVEGMGGRIWTRRRPDGGGEFAFTVPVLDADEDDAPAQDDGYGGIDTGSERAPRVE